MGFVGLLLVLTLWAWWRTAGPAQRVVLSAMGLSALAYPSAAPDWPLGGTRPDVPKDVADSVQVMCGSSDTRPVPGGLEAAQVRHAAYLQERQRAESTLLSRLSQHPSAQAQAVAMYLKSHPTYFDEPQLGEIASLKSKACYGSGAKSLTSPECAAANAHSRQVVSQIAAKYAPAAQSLALLAAKSNDPQIYALAINACNWHATWEGGQGMACSQLSLERWAQLDPGEMAPWLTIAGESQDPNAWATAALRASQAPRSSYYPGLVSKWLQTVVEPDGNPMEAMEAGVLAATRESGFVLIASLQTSMQRCSEPEVQDANRRQLCEGLAKAMTETSTNIFDRRVGTRLGERLGWPPEKTERLQSFLIQV